MGWRTRQVDGHDHGAIYEALAAPPGEGPLCVVAQTIKGYGCTPMEGEPAWHHRSPTAAELPDLLRALR
jgi:transketolase